MPDREPPQPDPLPVEGPRCPNCRCDHSSLPPSAVFCPRCGHKRDCAKAADPSDPAEHEAIVTHWQRLLEAIPPETLAGPTGQAIRSVIVQGYAAALHRLGVRYESGQGAAPNEDEAVRCYAKAARLGNPDARQRLADKGIGKTA